MAQNSNIEWTERTWNPVIGCSMCSPGCAQCYAEKMSKRLAAMARADLAKGRDPGRKRHYLNVINDKGRFNGVLEQVPEALTDPLTWRKPATVFVNSMSDLFHEAVPFEFIDKVFAVMAMTPQHTYQILTKRPARMAAYFDDLLKRHEGFDGPLTDIGGEDAGHRLGAAAGQFLDGTWIWGEGKSCRRRIEKFISDSLGRLDGYDEDEDYEPRPIAWPFPNVWLGDSPVNQEKAEEYIPHLLRTPAAVRFLSIEPMLGPVDLRHLEDPENRLRSLGITYSGLSIKKGIGLATHLTTEGDDDYCLNAIDWVILGCESLPGGRVGRNAEHVNDQMADVVRQCRDAGVPVFVKQVNVDGRVEHDLAKFPEDLRVREMPKGQEVARG